MNTHQNTQSLTERARQEEERPALHRFRVGEMYANRRGNYEVMQIAPPKMTIRYDDGEMVTADIVILARIWDNMQAPPEQPEPAPRRRAAPQRAAPQRTAPQPRAAKTAPRSRKADD